MVLPSAFTDLTVTNQTLDLVKLLQSPSSLHSAKLLLYSLIFHLLLHHIISYIICKISVPTYSTLKWDVRMEWDSRVVSSVHALVTACLSLYSLLYESSIWADKIGNTGEMATKATIFSTGYFIADSITMPIYWRNCDLITYWIHHGLAGVSFTTGFLVGTGQFYCVYRLLSEFSTPFLNFAWFVRTMKLNRTSWPVVVNSVLLTLTFVLFRLVTIPYHWYSFVQISQSESFLVLKNDWTPVFSLWMLTSVVLDGLNIKWSFKIISGGYKTVSYALVTQMKKA